MYVREVMLNLGPSNYPFNETYATLIPVLPSELKGKKRKCCLRHGQMCLEDTLGHISCFPFYRILKMFHLCRSCRLVVFFK